MTTVLLLALGGCEFFTATAFPEYVSLIQDETSVSKWIDSEDTYVYMSAAVHPEAPTLFVIVDTVGEPLRLLIIDENLDIVANYTEAELNAQLGGSGSLGTGMGFDLAFRPVVGHFVFDPESYAPVVYSDTTASTEGTVTVRFDEDETSENRVYVVTMSGQTMTIDYYDQQLVDPFPWITPSGTVSGQVGSQGPYYVSAAFPLDSEGVGTAVVFAIWDESSQEVSLLPLVYDPSIPLDELPATGIPPWSPTLIEDRRIWDPIKDVERDGTFVTRGGWVFRDDDSGTHRLFSGESGKKKATFDGLEGMEHRAAYPFDASFFYVLDLDSQRILKLVNWW
ncbi:MAG: hypothetical protein GVY14_05745 [Spirochaetes bacterium]|jgi:hypothetical protein|nr:hypothetical protein [Spirochaetota bacterium]